MRSSQQSSEASRKEEKNRKSLPRKCALIRRTILENGVEKTELRFVSYTRVGEGVDENGFLKDIGEFLEGHIKKDEETDEKSDGTTTPPHSPSATPTTTSTRSSEALQLTHHEATCGKAELLRKAIPTLERLVAHYQQTASRSKDPSRARVLKMTAQDVLEEVQTALLTGGLGNVDQLMTRIKELNKIQTEEKKNKK